MSSEKPFILLVEDDDVLALGVATALRAAGFEVTHVDTGEGALEVVARRCPDLVLLDVNLPGMDGLTVLRRLRADGIEIPVLVVSARGHEVDRVLGFELGADDYVTKPFSVRELEARIRRRLRRADPGGSGTAMRFGTVSVDVRRQVLFRDGEEYRMTTHEARVLAFLLAHQGQDVSREELLEHVWGYSPSMATRTVDNQILRLRKKIEIDPAQPRHILTVHGTGYRFEP